MVGYKRYQKREDEVDKLMERFNSTNLHPSVTKAEFRRWQARNFARKILRGDK